MRDERTLLYNMTSILYPATKALQELLKSMKFFCTVLAIFFANLSFGNAADWPQILGPHRDGKSNEQIDGNWPKDGPSVSWSFDLGQGFSGVAVVGNQVIAFHRQGRVERVESIDRRTGKRIWKNDADAYYRGGFNPDSGPRSVPVVTEKTVFVFGAAGVARAIDRTTGATIWIRDLHKDFAAQEGYFGAGSTPIVANDLLLINVGGRKNAAIVALETASGKTRWNAVSDDASYSSPVQYLENNKARILFITRLHAVSIDPANGSVDFSIPFGARGPTVNAAMPVFVDGKLFLTASYGIGGSLVDISNRGGAKKIWANDESLSSQYNTPISHDGFLYGIHGREDVGLAELRCVEAKSGTVRWSKPRFGVAHLLMVGDKLLAVTIDGQIVLFSVDPDRYHELARAQVSGSTTRALPAYSDGQLFLRDTKQLHCVQLRSND